MRSRTATGPRSTLFTRDNRAAPARDDRATGLPGVEPGPARLELAVLPLTPQAFESGRPGSNGPPRSGAPVLFRLSYVRARSLRQESNPHLGRTKGACLPLTLRRLDGDGGSRTRSSSLQARCSTTRASSPWLWTYVMRTDGVEPPQREAPRLQRGELTLAQRPRTSPAWAAERPL